MVVAVTGDFLGATGLALLAGVSFALLGVAYKLGDWRKLETVDILLVCSVVGAIFSGTRAASTPAASVPSVVWVLGIVAGLTQYLAVRLVQVAIRRGPLSSLWCAVSMYFVPVILYGWLLLHQTPGALQWAAIAAAFACVVTASGNGTSPEPAPGKHRNLWQSSAYGLILGALLVMNSFSALAQSDLSQRAGAGATHLALYGNWYYCLLYATLGISILVDRLITRRRPASLSAMAILGLLAGAGSLGGMYCLGFAAELGGSIMYALCGAAGIVVASAASVAFFREKLTLRWIATILLGITAVWLGTPRQ